MQGSPQLAGVRGSPCLSTALFPAGQEHTKGQPQIPGPQPGRAAARAQQPDLKPLVSADMQCNEKAPAHSVSLFGKLLK